MLSDDEIQLMEAIGASGSLTRAAASLGKAPSTVSYTLRQIETRFDALLFDRRDDVVSPGQLFHRGEPVPRQLDFHPQVGAGFLFRHGTPPPKWLV